MVFPKEQLYYQRQRGRIHPSQGWKADVSCLEYKLKEKLVDVQEFWHPH
jgi:hypothetical protein